MAISTTYGEVRIAYSTLVALTQGKVQDGAGPYVPNLPLATVLKLRRMMGVMRPLAVDLAELEGEIFEKAGIRQGQQLAPAVAEQIRDLYATAVEVGCDTLAAADLNGVDHMPASMIGVLVDLGPFFVE